MSPQSRPERANGSGHLMDLGSQLEDLFTQVMRCERWARFDDRLDLAFAVEQLRQPRTRR